MRTNEGLFSAKHLHRSTHLIFRLEQLFRPSQTFVELLSQQNGHLPDLGKGVSEFVKTETLFF